MRSMRTGQRRSAAFMDDALNIHNTRYSQGALQS